MHGFRSNKSSNCSAWSQRSAKVISFTIRTIFVKELDFKDAMCELFPHRVFKVVLRKKHRSGWKTNSWDHALHVDVELLSSRPLRSCTARQTFVWSKSIQLKFDYWQLSNWHFPFVFAVWVYVWTFVRKIWRPLIYSHNTNRRAVVTNQYT